jgi:arylsulfatase A-like enzyme/Flp pilus assembly protein TadD
MNNREYNEFRLMKKKLFMVMAVIVIVGVGLLFLIPHLTGRKKIIRDKEANILLITLDTTRADRIGAYGYAKATTPNIDALAESGVVFRQAYAPVPITLPSHCSILTGTYPPSHQVRINGSYFLAPQVLTLPEVLKDAGFETAAFVSSFVLDSRFGTDQGFDLYDDRMEGGAGLRNLESERKAAGTFAAFKDWFEARSAKKFFAWVHFFDPHAPYEPPPAYRKGESPEELYDGEISFMDFYVGEVVNLLKNKKAFDRTLIILAGDHGEAFGEHGENGHTLFCYEENIRVPLVVLAAKGFPQPATIETPANLIDILPTVLDFVGLPMPGFVQGKSLLPLVQGKKWSGRPFYFESLFSQEVLGCASLKGVLRGGWKFVLLPKPELYNLEADPAEKINLVASESKTSLRLKGELEGLEREFGRNELTSLRPVNAEEKQKLESLGYLGGGRKPPKSDASRDPKDRVDFWNRSVRAKQFVFDKKYDEAEGLLLSLAQEDPHFGPVVESLAELYSIRGKTDELEHFFDDFIARNHENTGIRILYAIHLVRLGLAQKALDILEGAEDSVDIGDREHLYYVRGSAFGRLERYREAAQTLARALEIEPEDYEVLRLMGYTRLRLQEYSEALSYLKKAERGIPDDPRLLEDMSMTYANLKNYSEAKVYFDKAVKANPSARIYANYALVYAEEGDYPKAISLMENALRSTDLDLDLRRVGESYLFEWRQKINIPLPPPSL